MPKKIEEMTPEQQKLAEAVKPVFMEIFDDTFAQEDEATKFLGAITIMDDVIGILKEYASVIDITEIELLDRLMAYARNNKIELQHLINRVAFPPINDIFVFQSFKEIQRIIGGGPFECPKCRQESDDNNQCDPIDKQKESCGYDLFDKSREQEVIAPFNYIVLEKFIDVPLVSSCFTPIKLKKALHYGE